MKILRKLIVYCGFIMLALWMTGCSTTAPVLLQLPSEKSGTAEIPLKVGLVSAQKGGEQKISTIKTYGVLGCWQYYAKMPRRSEVDYFDRSIGDYFRDTKTFTYCYGEPFDRNDINLVLRINIKDLKVDNTSLGSTIQTLNTLPYIQYCSYIYMYAGGPIETFVMIYNLELILETPAGQEIARYQTSGSGKEGVNFYEQPFGNYLWYNSIFQKQFFKAMDYFVDQMKNDRAKIMQAVGK